MLHFHFINFFGLLKIVFLDYAEKIKWNLKLVRKCFAYVFSVGLSIADPTLRLDGSIIFLKQSSSFLIFFSPYRRFQHILSKPKGEAGGSNFTSRQFLRAGLRNSFSSLHIVERLEELRGGGE